MTNCVYCQLNATAASEKCKLPIWQDKCSDLFNTVSWLLSETYCHVLQPCGDTLYCITNKPECEQTFMQQSDQKIPDVYTVIRDASQSCQKSWNGCKFPENALLPILLYRSIWEKFPEDWHLSAVHAAQKLNSSTKKSNQYRPHALATYIICQHEGTGFNHKLVRLFVFDDSGR